MFAAGGALFVWDLGGAAVVAGVVGGVAVWFLMLGAILAVNYLLVPARSRRAFAQQKALHHRVEVEWSPARIRLESQHGMSEFDWRDFLQVEQGRDVILLFQSEYLFNFVPTRALPDELAADFIASAKARRADPADSGREQTLR